MIYHCYINSDGYINIEYMFSQEIGFAHEYVYIFKLTFLCI